MDNARTSVYLDLRYGILPPKSAIQSENLTLLCLPLPQESGDAEIQL